MYWLSTILILPYIFLLLKIYRSLTRIKPFNRSAEPSAFISVVAACRNEEKNLPDLLNCLRSQDYPFELFEVIIVNDNSTDRTAAIASAFNDGFSPIVVNNTGTGKKQAIRTGIHSSRGSLIITTDADCIMGKRWISTIAALSEKESPDMIICPVQLEEGKGFFSRFQELEFLSLQGITAGTAAEGNSTMCNGANLAFRKQIYLDHSDNLFDKIASGDDIFLLHSVKSVPRSKILWLESADAIVTAGSSSTALKFLKQRRRWISKGRFYYDKKTLLLAIVTFVTIVLQISSFAAGFINSVFWILFVILLTLKSIPDLLILKNTTDRYGRSKLMRWFLPAQLIYPFYVFGVMLFSIFSFRKYEN